MPLRPTALALALALPLAPAAAQGVGGTVVKDPYADFPRIVLPDEPAPREAPVVTDAPQAPGLPNDALARQQERAAARQAYERDAGLPRRTARALDRAERNHASRLKEARERFERDLARGKPRPQALADYSRRVARLEQQLAEKVLQIDRRYFEHVWGRQGTGRD